jgi:hypothetical protein
MTRVYYEDSDVVLNISDLQNEKLTISNGNMFIERHLDDICQIYYHVHDVGEVTTLIYAILALVGSCQLEAGMQLHLIETLRLLGDEHTIRFTFVPHGTTVREFCNLVNHAITKTVIPLHVQCIVM